jgi:hypothetical protein
MRRRKEEVWCKIASHCTCLFISAAGQGGVGLTKGGGKHLIFMPALPRGALLPAACGLSRGEQEQGLTGVRG